MTVSNLPADTLVPQSFEAEVPLKVGYKYLLSLPEGYETAQDKKWPLIVFLHGAGERGDNLELLKKHGPPKLTAAGKKFEAIVASPQVPGGQVWNPHGVKALVDELIKTHRVDTNRIYLTGISMGGFGTWDTIFEYPDVFAAAAPVCGGAGVKFVIAEQIKHIPLWIFHGGKDVVVEPAYSQRMYDVMTKLKANVQLTMYPGVGHDSWTRTYDDPKLWEWLFLQTKAN
jgi:predicted peptidase